MSSQNYASGGEEGFWGLEDEFIQQLLNEQNDNMDDQTMCAYVEEMDLFLKQTDPDRTKEENMDEDSLVESLRCVQLNPSPAPVPAPPPPPPLPFPSTGGAKLRTRKRVSNATKKTHWSQRKYLEREKKCLREMRKRRMEEKAQFADIFHRALCRKCGEKIVIACKSKEMQELEDIEEEDLLMSETGCEKTLFFKKKEKKSQSK